MLWFKGDGSPENEIDCMELTVKSIPNLFTFLLTLEYRINGGGENNRGVGNGSI